jgi:hypothetical protein
MIMNISPKFVLIACDSYYWINDHTLAGVMDFGERLVAIRASLRPE